MYIEVYRQKPLRVHSFLAGIPLRTLERVELSGGRDGMTIEEISGVVGFGGEVEMEVGPVTQALFWLRTLIGRILRWDEAKELITPMLKWVIYPAMLKGVKRRWEQAFPNAGGSQSVADAAQRQAGQAIQDQGG